MNTSYQFHADSETSVFINQSNGVTISQASSMGEIESVMFFSRKRCEDIGKALIALSKIAKFEQEDDNE